MPFCYNVILSIYGLVLKVRSKIQNKIFKQIQTKNLQTQMLELITAPAFFDKDSSVTFAHGALFSASSAHQLRGISFWLYIVRKLSFSLLFPLFLLFNYCFLIYYNVRLPTLLE